MPDRPPGRQLTEDEWIVLLDVYQTHRSERISVNHPAIIRASETLRALALQAGRTPDAGFRPPSGLHRQLEVFRRLDPLCQRTDRKVPQLAEAVWKRFSADPQACRMMADTLRAKSHR
jgi:hypothetical protein